MVAAVPHEPVNVKQMALAEMQSFKQQIEQHFNTAEAFIRYSEDENVVQGIVKAFKNTVGNICSAA